jgi:dTDP-4-amino-4,6-dideoxygalactose transaminase
MVGDRGRAIDALFRRYDEQLRRHGDTPRGALWPNEEDVQTRFDVMLDVIDRVDEEPVTLCDLGCGTGGLLAHIRKRALKNISYVGVDRSELALSYARAKFPEATFLEIDISDPQADLKPLACDYLVANGLFIGKFDMTHDEMWSFLASTVRRLWPFVRRGIAFNAMSTIVEWSRDDLFHLSMDEAARLLHAVAGRNVRIRADYGLYEFTAFASKRSDRRATSARVSVMRPLLPSTADLIRYLPRIDKTRIYTNHGPLVSEFQQRMCETLDLPPGSFVTASNGTAALTGAILATAGRATSDRPLAIVPAFTFVATAIAVEECGFTPYFVDVDAETWMLEPRRLLAHPQLARAGLIVPVAPFGKPVPQAPWLAFRDESAIPVVIDGAACFDLLVGQADRFVGELPMAVSFHATKSFATGEGGGVFTKDAELATRVVQALNFGFHERRESRTPSINGKMSEYHAAVGLAELDNRKTKTAALARVAANYRQEAARAGMVDRFIVTPEISSSYVLLACGDPAQAQSAAKNLDERRIGYRFWYGAGLHAHQHFRAAPHDELPTTHRLGATIMGLPVAPDLPEDTVARIVSALENAIQK